MAENGGVRVLLKFELDVGPDVVWDALRSTGSFRKVSAPVLTMHSLEPGGFPREWPGGDHLLSTRFLGILPAGRQRVSISYRRAGGTRILVDEGGPESGALKLMIRSWRHSMAVSPSVHGRTLYRDQLEFRAGAWTPFAFLMLWTFWQWRGARLRTVLATRPVPRVIREARAERRRAERGGRRAAARRAARGNSAAGD